jgi:hypothetical protein
VLTIDFLEFLDRLLGIGLRVEKIEPLVVEPVGGLIGGRVVLLGEKIETTAGSKAARQESDRAYTRHRHPSAVHNSGYESLEHERIHAKLLPRKAASQNIFALRDNRAGLSENTSLAMRLSRHSARIKAKVKPKSSGFQNTSGP